MLRYRGGNLWLIESPDVSLAKTFPLSLSIFWRFVVTFPILLIGLLLYGALGGLIGVVIGLLLPGTVFITTFLVSASSGVIPVMVGARFGFQSKLIRPSVGYRKLVVPAIAYGAAESLAIGLVLAPVIGLTFVQIAPDLVDLTKAPDTPALDWLTSAGASVPLAGLAVVIAVFAIASAARASLLVPLAAAALGSDPDDRPYTPFRNLGASFWPLFALVALSYVAMMVLYVVAFLGLAVTVGMPALAAALAEVERLAGGAAMESPIWPIVALMLSFTLIGLWGLSLQCAGAVLAYQKLQGGRPSRHMMDPAQRVVHTTPPPSPNSGPRLSAEELRALRKSRQTRD